MTTKTDPEYKKALRAGEIVEIEGLKFRMIPGDLQPGDTYIAERNTGPKLLTVKTVNPRGWIQSQESAYSFDTWECVKIEWVEVLP